MKLRKLFRRDKGRCHLCGRPVRKGEASRDHLVPVSAGGKSGKRNLKLAHRDCNNARGAATLPPKAMTLSGRQRRG